MLIAATICFALAIGASSTQATPSNRRTPQITCNDVDTSAPYLFLGGSLPGFNSSYRLSDALAAIGSKSSAGVNPEVLQNSGPFNGDDFKFVTCASAFMKYPASTNGSDNILRYYGHIEPMNGDGKCVTRTKVADGHEFFTNSPCRYNDDAGQEAQYFQLKAVHVDVFGQNVTYNLTLVGHPQGLTGDKFYFKPGTSSAPAVTIARNIPSGYQLGMEYIHIN